MSQVYLVYGKLIIYKPKPADASCLSCISISGEDVDLFTDQLLIRVLKEKQVEMMNEAVSTAEQLHGEAPNR